MTMQLFSGQNKGQPSEWSRNVQQDSADLMKKGGRYSLVVLGLFGLWAGLVPLSSSVVATGRVMAASQNKLLQHPTDGVVRAIAVADGADLKAGDVVIEIDPEASRAELASLKSRFDLLSAQKARFEAEQSNLSAIETLPKPSGIAEGVPRPKPGVDAAKKPALSFGNDSLRPALALEQQGELQARLERFRSELSSLQNQIRALESEHQGYLSQIATQKEQVALQKEQLEKVRPLVAQKYFSKVRFTQMEVASLEAASRLTQLEASARSSKARIAEVEDRVAQLLASRREEFASELAKLDAELRGLSEQIKAAEKALSYTQLRAPSDGTLVKLVANTVGGVIKPGEIVGEIVPADGGVMVEARIPPADVASVSVGQQARIVVTAFNRRLIDPFEATVTYVAADSSVDKITGEQYFAVRLAFDKPGDSHQQILPGMGAESYIQLGSRTFLGYVMKPINDSFRKAFQER